MNPRCELVPGKPYPVICRGRPTTAVRARRFRPPALLYSTAVRRPNVSGGCHLTLDCKKRADCRILWLLTCEVDLDGGLADLVVVVMVVSQ